MPETMKKLQGAGKEAKASGLDLNIDPKIEKQLLERDVCAEACAGLLLQQPGGPNAQVVVAERSGKGDLTILAP